MEESVAKQQPHRSLVVPAAITLLVAIFLARWVVRQSQQVCSFNGRRSENPPMRKEPFYTFGLQGQLRTIMAAKAQRLPERMVESCEEMGDTWAYTLFGTRTILTRDQRNIQAMLATQFDDFGLATDRDSMHQLLGTNGIFTQSGSDWAASRALLRPSFDRAQVADLDRLEIFFERLRQRIEDEATASGGDRCIELQGLFQKLTMDSSSDFLLGSPVGALSDEPSGVNVQNFTEAFDIAQTVIATRWVLSNLYWLYNPKYFQQACSVVHSQVQKYVNRALKLRSEAPTEEKDTGKSKRYIFTEVLAETTQNPRMLQDQILSVMLAGRDTTASLLSWTALCLSRHPSVLQKLRAAIAETVGVDASAKIPTQAELRSITYLRWVLHEVLRLYPPVPANTRCPIKPTTLPFGGGADGTAPIALQKGEKVVASFFALHRRKDLYGPDADEFRPERWGEERMRKIGWGWVPFNGGPRICLGQQMALTHASYFVTRLLQVYATLEEDPKVVGLGVKYDTKITMYSGRGVNVRLE